MSKWRKQVRDGVLRGTPGPAVRVPERELARLKALERALAGLQEAHDLGATRG